MHYAPFKDFQLLGYVSACVTTNAHSPAPCSWDYRLLRAFGLWGVSLVAQMVESACNVGDMGLTPGSGRSPGEGNGYPLQYSCHGQRGLAGYSPCDRKKSDTTEQLTLHFGLKDSQWLPAELQQSHWQSDASHSALVSPVSKRKPRQPTPSAIPDQALGAGGLLDTSTILVPRSLDWSRVEAPEQQLTKANLTSFSSGIWGANCRWSAYASHREPLLDRFPACLW